MENFGIIKYLIRIFLGGTLFALPFFVFSYDDTTTHPALTQELVRFYNASFPDKALTAPEMDLVIKGSVEEDKDPRWLRHFYDPVYNRGLTLRAFDLADPNLAFIGGGAQTQWTSSKLWGTSSKEQNILNFASGILTNYFSGTEDYSWERAVYEYAWGDKTRGLEALGHVLHLLEDAAVPDHTRNDAHPPIAHFGSPYETWTKKFSKNNFTYGGVGKKPIIFSGIAEYFDSMANYSNRNFFSKDTILIKEYLNPVYSKTTNKKLSNGSTYTFGYKFDNNVGYHLVKIDKIYGTDSYSYSIEDFDSLILSDYWSLLSEQAILHGAGAIKLFFDEVGKEKKTRELFNKNRPWVALKLDSAGAILLSGYNRASNFLAGYWNNAPDTIADSATTPHITAATLSPAIKSPSQPAPAVIQIAVKPADTIPDNAPTVLGSEFSNIPLAPITLEQSFFPVSFDTSPEMPIGGAGGPPPQQLNMAQTSSAPSPDTDATSTASSTLATDTTTPETVLAAEECANSHSFAGCLIRSASVSLMWSTDANDLLFYTISCEAGGAPCANFQAGTTTSTSTHFAIPDNTAEFIFRARATDHAGNTGAAAELTILKSARPVVINEIAWAGTSVARAQDEWIELYNPSPIPVELLGLSLVSLTDGRPNIPLTGTIPAKGFYLIERSDDETVSGMPADIIASFGTSTGAGLSNSGEVLAIMHGAEVIDRTPDIIDCAGWCGGFAQPYGYYTMERVNPLLPGDDPENWGDHGGFLYNGYNADGLQILGTPKTRNSINHLLRHAAPFIDSDTTLTLEFSPYVVNSLFEIRAGATLTVKPGVVIKFWDNSALIANGALHAEGTVADPIIFTAIHDDAFGGDTNKDATSTEPFPGSWSGIKIRNSDSIIDRAIIRYGGFKDSPAFEWHANIRVENSGPAIRNSIIEHSGDKGIWHIDSMGTTDSNIIRKNAGEGIVVEGGNPEISKNSILENGSGIYIISSPATANRASIHENSIDANENEAIFMSGLGAYASFSNNTAARNSTNGIRLNGSIGENYTLAGNLPFVIRTSNDYSVPAGTTLSIAPGTIIKLEGAIMSISGSLAVNGTGDNPVVFTSLHDDDCGIGGCGDTDNATTTPNESDWNWLHIFNAGTSTIQNAIIRYGGTAWTGSPIWGALIIEDTAAPITIERTTIERNWRSGIFIKNSPLISITESTIREHTLPALPSQSFGIYLLDSTITIADSAFKNNSTGVYGVGASAITGQGGNIFEGNGVDYDPPDLFP